MENNNKRENALETVDGQRSEKKNEERNDEKKADGIRDLGQGKNRSTYQVSSWGFVQQESKQLQIHYTWPV